MTLLSNAQIILDDRVITGSLVIENGIIITIEAGTAPGGIDCDGDYLTPGIIDLHTDNLERQVLPRSNARWPSRSALLAHDAQCAVAGVTTVFDALCLGDIGFEQGRNQTFDDGLNDLQALAATGMLRSDHYLHLRCELPAGELPAMLDRAIDDALVRLISLMDHSPGVGQYADVEKFRRMRRREGHTDEAITTMIGRLADAQARFNAPNRALVLERARARAVPIASHDDRTVEEIARNHADGIAIAEFPVTHAAAAAARACGMTTIAGAPNIVRGGSHSGNVAALDLIRAGLVDALASDYVPASMIEAAFACVAHGACDLPHAIRLITANPAAMVGLTDRGRLAPGLRADIIRVRLHDTLPVVRAVWREGTRVG
ncbi:MULTISPECIES: alpha-D-ribose 1-methylphosphonate 5-triphosphate diphosphatase [Acidiphilium]|uniref:Alpha-D-ribose 1-methylphosphonate 5-triphosphate diphosphatase n=1 Tax=Acidiphilium rubrum TaxID=526 RepID=A0A8G2FF13_ACIRU|nr:MULTISPECIES: alpha-D-ribose 1-methylphosphonate 5-triphosphate diphosphatase [Acidiphilium]SIQ10892.1 alpha-D-ribose 1-methylphosphonate 5-triphosphate diphosphatase [Acidiphilium rubrum]